MSKILFLAAGLFSFCFARAQNQADSFTSVQIIKDPRLDLLVKKQIELNKEVYLQNSRTGQGYRVLVINTNDRSKAMDIKSRLLRDFPEHKTYFIYQSPYFKVQIGNFKEIKEADALKKQISKIYREGVVVVPSVVEFKSDSEELIN